MPSRSRPKRRDSCTRATSAAFVSIAPAKPMSRRFSAVTENALRAGYPKLLHRAADGVRHREAYAGIIDDPLYGRLSYCLAAFSSKYSKTRNRDGATARRCAGDDHRIKLHQYSRDTRRRAAISLRSRRCWSISQLRCGSRGQIKALDLTRSSSAGGGGVVAVDIAPNLRSPLRSSQFNRGETFR